MTSGKVVGPHRVPIEAYKHCPALREKLFELLSRIWDEEAVPTNFAAAAKFKMIYKNKGSTNDPKNIEIGLLNYKYKVLSCVLLNHMLDSSEDFLQD